MNVKNDFAMNYEVDELEYRLDLIVLALGYVIYIKETFNTVKVDNTIFRVRTDRRKRDLLLILPFLSYVKGSYS